MHALLMRYSHADDRWQQNHGFCDVRSSVVIHVTLTLLMRLYERWTIDLNHESPSIASFFNNF